MPSDYPDRITYTAYTEGRKRWLAERIGASLGIPPELTEGAGSADADAESVITISPAILRGESTANWNLDALLSRPQVMYLEAAPTPEPVPASPPALLPVPSIRSVRRFDLGDE